MEWNWWAGNTRKTKKIDRRTKKVNNIEIHEIRIESIKDTTKRKTEEQG